ncbi:class I SAM-dependent methyltransferase [Candidatus Woesebacteria bacterium]|nr:class I SAM-dependent methyltransferase [Candidatus Woesebacteria bacterium]
MIKTNYNKHYFENALYKGHRNSQRDTARKKLITSLKKSGSLLEIGSGEGYLLALLENTFKTTGIEISDYAAQYSQKIVKTSAVLNTPIENLNLGTKKFDVILAFNVFEHMLDPYTEIKKIAAALKKDGVLIGSVPNNHGLVGSLFTQLTNYIDRTHVATYRTETRLRLFSKAGLDVHTKGEIPLGRNYSFFISYGCWKECSMNMVFIAQQS